MSIGLFELFWNYILITLSILDLEVPRDVEVKINESSLTANVTWKAPLNVYVKHTSIVLIMKDSNGQRLPINHTTVPSNFTQFDVKLKKCKEYILELKFCYSEAQCSEATKQMIVISGKESLCSDIYKL